MKLLTALLVILVLTACGQARSKSDPPVKKITGDFQADINSLIPPGEHTVDIMDQVMMSPRRAELNAKFQKAIQANPEWFKLQDKKFEETHIAPPYDPRVGMTEAEWAEYKKLMNTMSDMYVESSGQAKILVSKANDLISFKSEGKLSYLNSVTIDTRNKAVKMEEYSLPFLRTINVTDSDNVFKTPWRGYRFEFSNRDPALTEIPTTKEALSKISMKLYGFIIGVFEKTNKTYIEISGSELRNGQKIMSYKIPIVFE